MSHESQTRYEVSTLWMLLGMYQGRPFITAAELARDFFQHLSAEKLIRKVDAGEIDIALMRIEGSTKATRGVDIRDLADYLDRRSHEASEVTRKIHGRR